MSARLSEAELEDLLAALEVAPGGHDEALELSSLDVVRLVDLIEAVTDLVLGSREITRATFATRRSLLAMIHERQGA